METIIPTAGIVCIGAFALVFGLAYLRRHTADFETVRATVWALDNTLNAKLNAEQYSSLAERDALKKIVTSLQAEIADRDKQWVASFEGYVEHVDQRCRRVELHAKANDTSFQPLGKTYDTRLRT